jgi:cytochrome oxidase Cu insertion factor (SCO1/SenC/PrrC family)
MCPRLAKQMKKLQQSYAKNDSIVQFISFSIDPEHDSVAQSFAASLIALASTTIAGGW